MTLENAKKVLDLIESSKNAVLKRDLILYAIRYARIRADWFLDIAEDKSQRKKAHDALIDSCNILSRSMRSAGEDNSWRSILGDDRKEIGDFACFVHCILGLRAR
jgi:hypothetical protein